MRQEDWSGQGFAWDGLARVFLGTFIVLTLPFLTATAHAQQGASSSETGVRRIGVGERQIEVDHLPSSCESCAKQVREAQEETRRCEESFQAERAASGGVDLLTELLVSGRMDAHGIRAQAVSLAAQPESSGTLLRVTSFRSVNHVALLLEVQLPEGAPWRMEGVVLRSDAGVETPLKSWPPTPLPPGRSTLILEREAGSDEMRGSYALEVREAGGNRTIVIKQVEFP